MYTSRIALLKNKSFLLYLGSCALATLGNGWAYVGNSWLILQADNSVSALAWFMAAFWLPVVLFGPLGGVLADRYHPKLMLVLAISLRGLALVLFALYFVADLRPHSLYVLSFILGCCQSLYFPAVMVFIRRLLPQESMLYANSTLDIVYEVGFMIGIGTGGWLLAYGGHKLAYLAIGLGYFIGAILLLLTRPLLSSEETAMASTRSGSYWANFKAGINYIRQRPQLRIIYILQLLLFVNALIAPILIAPFAKNILHATAAQYGMIEASLSVGVVAGGLISPWLVERIGFYKVLLTELILMALSFACFVFIRTLLWADSLYFILGFCFSVWPLMATKAQSFTHIQFQGRVQSIFTSCSSLSILLLYLVFTFSTHQIEVPHLYWFEVLIALLALGMLRFNRVLFKS